MLHCPRRQRVDRLTMPLEHSWANCTNKPTANQSVYEMKEIERKADGLDPWWMNILLMHGSILGQESHMSYWCHQGHVTCQVTYITMDTWHVRWHTSPWIHDMLGDGHYHGYMTCQVIDIAMDKWHVWWHTSPWIHDMSGDRHHHWHMTCKVTWPPVCDMSSLWTCNKSGHDTVLTCHVSSPWTHNVTRPWTHEMLGVA